MELFILSLFCISLFLCLLLNLSILIGLCFGFILFNLYGLYKGYSLRELLHFSSEGIQTVKNILFTFILIGILTASYRQAGTIAYIVSFASQFMQPSVFLLLSFLLNCFISFLTGTAFGTAATMGVICLAMGQSMGMPTPLLGGAILAGSYFGDRCSPISTSALLVASITNTNIYKNIKDMIQSAKIPFIISCILYLIVGFFFCSHSNIPNMTSIFSNEFNLSIFCTIPMFVLLILSLCKVETKKSMSFSILSALFIILWIQKTPINALPKLFIFGFSANHSEVAKLLNGGGIQSMVKVFAIVCLSSAYAGLFKRTGLLLGIQSKVNKLSQKTNSYMSILIISILTGIIACNQTLTIMLTKQLTLNLQEDKKYALYLEDSAVVISPLIPWSIAGAVPLASVNAPTLSIVFAFFLYLLPIYQIISSRHSIDSKE